MGNRGRSNWGRGRVRAACGNRTGGGKWARGIKAPPGEGVSDPHGGPQLSRPLPAAGAGSGVFQRLPERETRIAEVSAPRPGQGTNRIGLGLPELQRRHLDSRGVEKTPNARGVGEVFPRAAGRSPRPSGERIRHENRSKIDARDLTERQPGAHATGNSLRRRENSMRKRKISQLLRLSVTEGSPQPRSSRVEGYAFRAARTRRSGRNSAEKAEPFPRVSTFSTECRRSHVTTPAPPALPLLNQEGSS